MKFKKRLYDILENNENRSSAKFFFDIFLAVIILISIVFIFLENEKGELNHGLEVADQAITIFFIIEFLARFYVSSDFTEDLRSRGLIYALGRKIKWFFRITTIIDFLAILPSVKFFRVFRTLRFLRLFRLLKAYRSFKTFREIDKIFTVLKGMSEENRVFYVFLSFTVFFLFILSFALYIAESHLPETSFETFGDAIWYAIQVIGFGDDTAQSTLGKIFSGLLFLINMAIFGFFISIILNKIQNIMDSITTGKIGKIKLEGHIIICGYTKSSQNVIKDLLTDRSNVNNIVLITQKSIEDNLSGVIYMNGDFTELETLQDANISKAKYAVVFAEAKESDTIKDVDLRTVMTIFQIEKEASHVHTIAEINDERNAEIIKDKIDGDEILYKEMIDSRIISSCITHKYISNMFYDMFGTVNNERIKETTISDIELGTEADVKQIKIHFLEKDCTFLGYIDRDNNSHLSPANNTKVSDEMRLIYIQN